MNPRYPVYIISKGRHESRLTVKSLEEIGVPYRIVVEPQEYDLYASVINPDNILVLPFSNLGRGSIPARNWVWEHSIEEGHERHWILDDNIRHFYRMNRGERLRVKTGAGFRAIEDWTDRYENVALSGMQYQTFGVRAPTDACRKPFLLNTRIYSCILIKNDIPFRWRGRYNEDTDLSLCVLKAGWCTALFYAFLCGKTATMTMKGGNTEDLYKQQAKYDGRLEMARHLQAQHPDVVRVDKRWGRWQHVVDYRPFARNRLRRKPDVPVANGPNEYGMVLKGKIPGYGERQPAN
jgi:hypothetical protein